MCLQFVSKLLWIPHYNSYSTESFIGFSMYVTTFKKIKIKTDDCCRFCGTEIETILHVFVMCENILPLWRSFSLHTYTTTSNRVGFSGINIILGETP